MVERILILCYILVMEALKALLGLVFSQTLIGLKKEVQHLEHNCMIQLEVLIDYFQT